MRTFVTYLFVAILVFIGDIRKSSAEEMRIILDEDFNWMTKEDADRTIARIKAAGFNVLVPCVWHGRGVTWRSKLAPKEPKWADKLGTLADPLEYLIQKAHSEGIQVHPWFTIALRQRFFLTQYYDEGTPEKSFNVHNAEFRAYMVSLINEVVTNYDIDGINIDYIRTKGVCLSERCIQDYKKFTGADLQQDFSQYDKIDSAGWSRIAEWNAVPIDDLVNKIHETVKRVKPAIPLSASSHAGMRFLLGEGTNSIKWANNGLLDFILHMDYAPLDKLKTGPLNSALSRMHDKSKLILMVGNYDTPPLDKAHPFARNTQEVVALLNYSRNFNKNTTSSALYEYRFLTDDQVTQIGNMYSHIPSAPSDVNITPANQH